MKYLLTIVFCFLCMMHLSFSQQEKQTVIILGIDGLNVYRFEEAETPNFDFLKQNGSWTFEAQANEPLYSSPNWKSIITGSSPDVHKVLKNGFDKDVYLNDPGCESELEKLPTIFTMLKRKDANAKIGVFEHWGAFHKLIDKNNIDKYAKWRFGPKPSLNRAIKFYKNNDPDLVFIHLDHCDRAGHLYGHESAKYLTKVEKADELLGKLIKSIQAKDNFENTTLIVVADHGGKGKDHGHGTVEGMTVPLLVIGPAIKKNYEMKAGIKIQNVAIIAMKVLGVERHKCWTALGVDEIY